MTIDTRHVLRLEAVLLGWVLASGAALGASPGVAVDPRYCTTHVYVAPDDLEPFVTSFVSTFGGTATRPTVASVTPTPSSTTFQAVLTPVGALSVFAYSTPVPYPFGTERDGFLVTDMALAVKAARANGAAVIVQPFDDAIGKDAVIEWPGGVRMQLYWHTTPPASGKALQTIPENRVYVAGEHADEFVRRFVAFSRGHVVSDEARAPGSEIGRPNESYRRIRVESGFGKMVVLVTGGHLPYPYGYEMTGYEVTDLAETLDKARAAGVSVLVPVQSGAGRDSVIVRFPGGYVAEIHSRARP